MYVNIKCILMVLTSQNWVFPPMGDKVVLEEYPALGTGEKQEAERKKSSLASFVNQRAATKMLETFKKLTLMECQAELHRFRNIYI